LIQKLINVFTTVNIWAKSLQSSREFINFWINKTHHQNTVSMINDIAKGAMRPPEDINKVYVLANSQLVVKQGMGSYNIGASYAIEEHTRPKKGKRTARKKSNGTKCKLLSGGGVKTYNIECYNCGKKGHYAQNCPENESNKSGMDDLTGLTLVEDGMCLVTCSKDTIKYYEIILDSGSQVNIVHPGS